MTDSNAIVTSMSAEDRWITIYLRTFILDGLLITLLLLHIFDRARLLPYLMSEKVDLTDLLPDCILVYFSESDQSGFGRREL